MEELILNFIHKAICCIVFIFSICKLTSNSSGLWFAIAFASLFLLMCHWEWGDDDKDKEEEDNERSDA